MPSLVRLSCARCGGDFALDQLEPVVVCPYCRHEQELPAEVVGRARAYESAAADELERAGLQELIAARYHALEPAAWTGLILGLGFTVPAILGVGGAFLGATGTIPAVAVGVVALVFLAGAALSLFRYKTERLRRARTHFDSTCPGCGGQNTLEIGQTVARCQFCGAALVPGERVAALGLGLARAKTRAAKLGAVAASRRFRVTADRRNRLFRVLFAGLTPVVPAIITIYSYQQYQRRLTPLGQVIVGAAATVAALGAPPFIALVRRLRWAGIDRAIDNSTRAPGCTQLDGVTGTVAWLNEYWPDEFGEYYDLQPGPSYRAAALAVRGFPVLLATEPHKFLHIAVAAGGIEHKLQCRDLDQNGFQLVHSDSGVLATLRGERLAGLLRLGPGDHLAAAVHALVGSLAAAGARPAARA